ncbi:MAG TPA: hypothetical protein VKE88_01680 [Candidatus Nanoarchaeia archaeon]|nr:hypothetical protein [Candidatus Nanoarchaeia archaeon]
MPTDWERCYEDLEVKYPEIHGHLNDLLDGVFIYKGDDKIPLSTIGHLTAVNRVPPHVLLKLNAEAINKITTPEQYKKAEKGLFKELSRLALQYKLRPRIGAFVDGKFVQNHVDDYHRYLLCPKYEDY